MKVLYRSQSGFIQVLEWWGMVVVVENVSINVLTEDRPEDTGENEEMSDESCAVGFYGRNFRSVQYSEGVIVSLGSLLKGRVSFVVSRKKQNEKTKTMSQDQKVGLMSRHRTRDE